MLLFSGCIYMAAGRCTFFRKCLQTFRTVPTVQIHHYAINNVRNYVLLSYQNFERNQECSTCSMSSFTTFRSMSRSKGKKRHTGKIVALLLPNHIAFLERRNSYSSRPSGTHYYNILNVTPHATQSQIKAAYYELSKVYHPDINKHHAASVKFSSITEAYEVLGNVRKRHLYDRGVLNPQAFRRSGREQEEDGQFHRDEEFTSKQRAPHTGHTKMYNFDEFYRQHYQNVREKKNNEKLAFENWQKAMMELEQRKATNMVIMGLFILIGTLFVILSHADGIDTNNRKK